MEVTQEGEEVSTNSSEEANLCLTVRSDSEASSEESRSDSEASSKEYNEVKNYSYKDLVYLCLDLTKTIDTLESKIEKLKYDRRELVHENFRL